MNATAATRPRPRERSPPTASVLPERRHGHQRRVTPTRQKGDGTLVPITFCTPPNGCPLTGSNRHGDVTDTNPRSCNCLTAEVAQLIDVVPDALAEAAAIIDIFTTEDPTLEIIEAASDLAVALFLGRRALQDGLDTLQRRHPDRPAYFIGARIAADMEHARRGLVHALLDEAQRLIA